MEIVVAILLIIGVVGFIISKNTKTVRRASEDRADIQAHRVPALPKCPCGKRKCPYKGKQHPPLNKQQAFVSESLLARRKRQPRR